MALIKSIELDNGVSVNYHRIVSVNNVVNQASIIEVESYTSKQKRLEEIAYLENPDPHKADMNVYNSTERIAIPYNANLTVDMAYEYLKSTEKYSNSEDDQNQKEC